MVGGGDGGGVFCFWRACYDGKKIKNMNFIDSIFGKKRNGSGRRVSRDLLKGILHGSPIPQFVIDKNHFIVHWNAALAEYTGFPEKEMIGTRCQWQAFYDFERPCLADLLADQKLSLIARYYRGKYAKSKLVPEGYEATDFFPRMGGRGTWLYFTAAPIRGSDGRIIGAVETLEDVTARKNAEEASKKRAAKLQKSKAALLSAVKNLDAQKIKLGEEKAKAEAILMSIGDGLVITSGKEGIIIMANRVFEELIGWKENEIIGHSLFDVMPARDADGNPVPPQKRFVSRVLNGDRPETATFYYGRKDGSFFPGAVTVSKIIFGGKNIGAVSVLRDVTREVQIDRAKTEFISLASHQLRDAPTAIGWCAEMLLNGTQGPLTAGQKDYVEEIYRRNKNATGLINDLLNVSRIDLGTFIIEPEEVLPESVCDGEIKQFMPQIEAKKLRLEKDYDKDLPRINADRGLLGVVFQNLISNAIYYTPEGGQIKIGLKFEKSAAGKKEKVVFSVVDNGCGIPDNQKDKIFQRMFRADNAKIARSGGSGLGLYVVKEIIDQAGPGWEIGFESKENQGSLFWIKIPLSGMIPRAGQAQLTRGAV